MSSKNISSDKPNLNKGEVKKTTISDHMEEQVGKSNISDHVKGPVKQSTISDHMEGEKEIIVVSNHMKQYSFTDVVELVRDNPKLYAMSTSHPRRFMKYVCNLLKNKNKLRGKKHQQTRRMLRTKCKIFKEMKMAPRRVPLLRNSMSLSNPTPIHPIFNYDFLIPSSSSSRNLSHGSFLSPVSSGPHISNFSTTNEENCQIGTILFFIYLFYYVITFFLRH